MNRSFKWISAVVLGSWLMLAALVQAQEQTWKVNLKDADIRAFITQIADITGYSFVVDPRVKGKVTVVSNAPMGREAVYEMFLSVLNVHGFAAIPGEGVIKIVNQNEAKQTADNTAMFERVPQEQLVTRVIQVKNANALELVPILRPMVAKYGHLAGVAAANALIISDHVNNIRRIERIVGELDSPSNYELEVVQLKDAWVGDMVKLLEELAPGELGKAAKGAANKFSVVADERSNRLILKGDENFREKMRELINKLDQPAAIGGTTKVIRLRHADAEKMAELLKGLMGDIASEKTEAAGGAAPPGATKVSIYADEGLNAIVVRAEPSLMQEVETIIEQLDVRRAQVLIEAAIVEISDGLSRALGAQLAVGDLSDEGATPAAITNFTNVGISASAVLAAIASGSDSVALGDISAIGLGEQRDDGVSWGLLIQALGTSGQAKLLSTPSIITMDNQESEIIVGQNVPFRTGEVATGTDGTANPFTTIERQDVGLTLRVTPSISEGELVRLDIQQESSSIAPSNESASDLITNKRQIKTSVLADDRETVVLGGLMSENYTISESKVPLLGDIPVLGYLFKSTNRTKDKQNLLVFLRPSILKNKEATREASEYKYRGLTELNLQINTELYGEEAAGEIPQPPITDVFERNPLLNKQ